MNLFGTIHRHWPTVYFGFTDWLLTAMPLWLIYYIYIFLVKKFPSYYTPRCESHLIHKRHTSQYLSVIKYSLCILMMKGALCAISLNILDAWRRSMKFCLGCLWLWCWQRGLISSQGAEEKLCARHALYKRSLVYSLGWNLHQRHPIQCRPGLNMSYFRPVCHQTRMAPLALQGCNGINMLTLLSLRSLA